MEECYSLDRENPKKKASIFSRLCFTWLQNICYESSTQNLELKSLYKTQKQDQSGLLADRFQKLWEEELNRSTLEGKKPRLLRPIFRQFLFEYICYGFLVFCDMVVIRGIEPIILAGLVRCFTTEGNTGKEMLLYGGGLSLVSFVSSFMKNHGRAGSTLIGMRVRIAVSSLIYRKILRLSYSSTTKPAAGHVINLLSNDVARFDIAAGSLNYLWIGPIQVVVVTYLMWSQIGTSALVGIVSILFLVIPLQFYLGSITSKYRKEVAKRSDHRVKLLTEILTGIQVIKMYVWEKPFEYILERARKEEITSLTKTSYVRAVLISFMCVVQRTALAITVICYVHLGHELQADLVFSSSLFLNGLQITFGYMFPLAISVGAESLVSLERLEEFLLMEEKQPFQIYPSIYRNICLKNIEASWGSEVPALIDLDTQIRVGSLCAVVGPVGSGKSSLLKLLLGEMIASSGIVKLSGNISYASQEPWLFTSTVRNNILFGQEYNSTRYNKIIDVCALNKDFEQFPAGDATLVGDRGISLSGGQRVRINLARAVYQDSDVYLLDDPLSAIDNKVASHLFDKCIVEYLKGKTRILVTHQLHFLKNADFIIVLNKGRMEAQGTYEELSRCENFVNLLLDDPETNTISNSMLIESTIPVEMKISSTCEDIKRKVFERNTEQVVNFEGSVFWGYVKYCGNASRNVLVLILIILCQVLGSGTDYWIALWTDQEDARHKGALNDSCSKTPNRSLGYADHVVIDEAQHTFLKMHVLIYVYIFLVVSTIIVTLGRSFLFFYSCMEGSKNLHGTISKDLLEAPMKFFDTSPNGRILNRFTKDMGTIDELLPKAVISGIQVQKLLT